ncbi:Phosphoglycolate phosphatase [Tsuneonella dongtanensis]|uniref:phosphoglycolate phosphatase n=1 Tax=Tsuneonella dongtanensis TaxID=692370 RepID=A0A1B2ADQ4_9SPHN|nr:HAD-IA family hydrolase [Tsuneonella dongtanensis]ANY20292.1 Phosphoglycolate phosphatase [Tsuneonella dongtanensis]
MADFQFDIVAFDLDGTLLETHRDLGTAVNHALTLGGFLAVPIESATDLIGGGAKIMLRRAIDDQGGCEDGRFRELYKAMLAYYGKHFADHTQPFPGAVDMLDTLRGRGVRLAVVTNKFEEFARGVLKALDMHDRFDCVIGGDTLGKGRAKPAPDPIWEARERCGGGRIAFVGDSSYDVRAGRAAGVPTIAVTFGYHDLHPHEMGADAVIDSLPELIPALESL